MLRMRDMATISRCPTLQSRCLDRRRPDLASCCRSERSAGRSALPPKGDIENWMSAFASITTAYRSGADVFGRGSVGPILTRVGHSEADTERNHSTVSGQNRINSTTAQTMPQKTQVIFGCAACHSRIRLWSIGFVRIDFTLRRVRFPFGH